jgi:prolyl-tRNA synthetase
MMGDGKALQMGTSHELGQNFARAFEIEYSDQDGAREFCWTTSWGVSTRMLGGLIMAHGDDAGLCLPPAIAPVQVVVVVVKDGNGTTETARTLVAELGAAGVRAQLDDAVDTPFGRRVIDWELKGVPIRVEVGPRDLESGNAVVARRAERTKHTVPLTAVVTEASGLLTSIQHAMLEDATRERDRRIVDMASVDAAVDLPQGSWARVPLSVLGPDDEKTLNEAGVTIRCLQGSDGSPVVADDDRDGVAFVARAY